MPARARPRTPPAGVVPGLVLRQAMIQDLSVSPDGRFAVYARRTVAGNAYRSRLWRTELDGGKPEPLTATDGDARRPRVSPDGRSILFLSRVAGRTSARVISATGGTSWALADTATEVHAAEWAPGAGAILLAEVAETRYAVGDPATPTARRITDLTWRADGAGIRDHFTAAWLAGGQRRRPEQVTRADADAVDAEWLPRRGALLVLADRRPGSAIAEIPQLWTVAPGHAPRLLAEPPGGAWALAAGPGDRIAFIGLSRPGAPFWSNWALFVLDGREVRRLAPRLDRSVSVTTYGDLIDPEAEVRRPVWIGADRLVALVSDRGRSLPYEFDTDGRSRPALDDPDVVCTAISAGGGRVAVVANERGNAAEVYEVAEGRLRRLTRNGSRWIAPFRVDPHPIRIQDHAHPGLDAWMIPAAQGRRGRPGRTVLQIHGGPYSSHGPVPWLEMLALAEAGVNVLYANPRGSASYGETFARSLVGRWGEPDGGDLLRLLDRAVRDGITDPQRVGLLGLSYGGFMVVDLLGRFPGRFAAGVSENPVTDLVSFFGSSDLGWFAGERGAGVGSLPRDLPRAVDRSPWVRIHTNRAPLLLLQAEQDHRCPPSQTELVFAILRSLERPVEMVRYPDESHYLAGSGRPDRRVDRIRRIVDWFARHL